MSTDAGGGSPALLSLFGKDTSVVPLLRNFRNGHGWETVVLRSEDVDAIQQRIRQFNLGVLKESMEDAHEAVRPFCGVYEARTERIAQLAMFLASKRTIDSKTACEEFLRLKVWAARHENRREE